MKTGLVVFLLCWTIAAAAFAVYAVRVSKSAKWEKVRAQRVKVYLTKEKRDPTVERTENRKKQVQNKLKAIAESKRHKGSRFHAVEALIGQAGIEVPVKQFWFSCTTAGFLAAMAWLLLADTKALAPVVFLAVTFFIPKAVLKSMAGRRQKKFTKHFPDAVDVLVRGLRSGLPVGECFRIIARESPDPVGEEFRVVVDQVYAGLTLPDALQRASSRMPTQEMRFFSTVIAVQQQTGGNLAEILSNISSVLRGRAQLREKMKALSGEARMSSMIIGSLPFLIGLLLFFINRPYISQLWETGTGNILLGVAASLMGFGIFVMNSMGKLE